MTPLERAQAAGREEITTDDGISWRIQRMPTLLNRRYARAQLVLTRAQLDALSDVEAPENPTPSQMVEHARQQTQALLDRMDEAEASEMGDIGAAILEECVTHWRVEGGDWRPVRIVSTDVPASEGDPDIMPSRLLSADTEAALKRVGIALTTGGEQRTKLLQAFRSRPNSG